MKSKINSKIIGFSIAFVALAIVAITAIILNYKFLTMGNKNSDFVQFTKKELKNGTETVSRTEYKGYVIRLRTYNGASFSISKANGKGFTELYKRNYSFGLLSNLLEKAKYYIDNHEDNLIAKFKSKTNHECK